MDLMHYIDRGGVIVLILIGLNIVGVTIMLMKFFQLTFINSKKTKIIQKTLEKVSQVNSSFLHQIVQNSIQTQIKSLESGLNIVKIIAIISPLLGLLGTVIGVLSAFDNIAQNGLGQTSMFAGGISVALITTIAGLIVAIPHLMGYNYFIGRIDKIELDIEQAILEKI
jgi:biopolymer transport protein ExbB